MDQGPEVAVTTVEFLAADVSLLVILFVWRVWSVARDRNTWPTPAPRHGCQTCRASFLDQRGLVWHRQAVHPDTFD